MALVLTCGLSFSGKSTLAARLAEELGAQITSLDRINDERGLDGGQGIPLEEWATTNRIAHERVARMLADGKHVIVDDTGSPRFVRDAWRADADQAGVPFVLVWVQIDPELQRVRVRSNRRSGLRADVTDAVLAEHAATFEPPTDEGALVVDAERSDDPATSADLAAAIRS
ncbi:ATP-binding protein [Curtobacterium sp. VKM Ac-2922]|uniref:AAA family ATPase n=1 Tax=Curtobacterium sp. VKM Ac-2922 TaxID=2929475 RepID=UPI001FB3BC03|nr:ATP-binding protein [Curtobacterium sp. VKM Ac-2922]MCJ1715133.1 ATP-binding protein [Curtobacterium sp. VKM Ac-2922]